MLSRRRRLRAKEVEEVLALGRSIHAGHLSMKFLQKNGPFRVAVVVPKSLAKKANVRNRLRRAAYDSLGAGAGPSHTGHAILFVRGIPTRSLRTVFKEETTALLKKI